MIGGYHEEIKIILWENDARTMLSSCFQTKTLPTKLNLKGKKFIITKKKNNPSASSVIIKLGLNVLNFYV